MTLNELYKSLHYTRMNGCLPEKNTFAFIARLQPQETWIDTVETSIAYYDSNTQKFTRVGNNSWDADEKIPENGELFLDPDGPAKTGEWDAWAEIPEWELKGVRIAGLEEAEPEQKMAAAVNPFNVQIIADDYFDDPNPSGDPYRVRTVTFSPDVDGYSIYTRLNLQRASGTLTREQYEKEMDAWKGWCLHGLGWDTERDGMRGVTITHCISEIFAAVLMTKLETA